MQILRYQIQMPEMVNPLARAYMGDTIYFDIDDDTPVLKGDFVIAIDRDEKPCIAYVEQLEPDIVLTTSHATNGALSVYGKVVSIVHDL